MASSTPDTTSAPVIRTGFEGRKWIWQGLFWGVFMFVFMGIFLPMAEKEPITWPRTGFRLLYWLAGGIVYGYSMKLYFGWQARRKTRKAESQLPEA